MRIQI